MALSSCCSSSAPCLFLRFSKRAPYAIRKAATSGRRSILAWSLKHTKCNGVKPAGQQKRYIEPRDTFHGSSNPNTNLIYDALLYGLSMANKFLAKLEAEVILVVQQKSKWWPNHHKISNIRCTISLNLNVPHLVLQLSLPNPMKPGVKSRMKM